METSEKTPIKKSRWKAYTMLAIVLFALGLQIYNSLWPKADVFFGSSKLHVLVANTVEHRYVGWNNKKDMGKYDGMLFIFPDQGQHVMTMRKTVFPVDIIWLRNNTIADIAPNVQPEPNKADRNLNPYFSRSNSNAVLEVPAGFAQKQGLKIGDAVIVVE